MPPEAKVLLLEKLRARRLTNFADNDPYQNDLLKSSLEKCIAARDLIESSQAQIIIQGDEIERDVRAYQRDLIAWQLTRAADVADERIRYFENLTDRVAENQKCRDVFHWFHYYAWGYDPRPDAPLTIMPLALFDRHPFNDQLTLVNWLNDLTFVKRRSGVCEKPREVGATDVTRTWLLHGWRFRQGFSALLTSRNQDEVDKVGNMSTLFERLRFQLRMLPAWQLPKGFDWRNHATFMRLINPENDATLIGSAPTSDLGRSGRYTVAIVDEGASLDESKGGWAQHTALSQSTRSQIWISSVKGRLNKFAELSHDNVTPKLTLDWRNHPWKDERWYRGLTHGYLGAAMTSEEIAQEIDLAYDASQPGKVLKNVREEYCFITEDELVAAFPGREKAFYRDGQFNLPTDWNWGRVTDYGESAKKENDTHVWAYSLFARPAERWPKWAVDSLFFFVSRPIEPIGATELQGFACYSQWEREYGLRGDKGFTRHPSVNDMSHEATDPKEVLLQKCGDNWKIPDLDFDKGRRKLVYHFELTDKHLPNPVRPELEGRARIYFVAPSGSYQMAKNDRTNSYFVTPSASQDAFRRLRAEIPSWHYPPEERGKPVPKMRPKSVFDDVITTVRYAVARWGVDADPLTYREQVEERVPDLYKLDMLQAKTGGKGLLPEDQMAYEFQVERAKRQIEPPMIEFDEWLRPVNRELEDE